MPNFLSGLNIGQTLRNKAGNVVQQYIGPELGKIALGADIPVVGGIIAGQTRQLANQFTNQATNGLLGALPFGVGSGIGGGLQGTKPKALHTEYASGEANQKKPYGGGEDIVFYMLRGDKTGSAANTDASVGELNPINPGGAANSTKIPANTIDGLTVLLNSLSPARGRLSASSQAGPRAQAIAVASPLVQLAQASYLNTQLAGLVGARRSLAGPFSGIKEDQEFEPGGASQNAVAAQSLQRALLNLTTYVRSDRQLVLSYPASEKYFEEVLHLSFHGVPHEGPGHQIADTIAHGKINDLAASLAFQTGGIRRTIDLIEAINDGRLGFTDGASAAEAQRLGPQGLRKRSTT